MSRINEKLGLRPAGARARLKCLSGVSCPKCPHTDVRAYRISPGGKKPVSWRWRCAACSYAWLPSRAEIVAYNEHVRQRDQLEVPAS